MVSAKALTSTAHGSRLVAAALVFNEPAFKKHEWNLARCCKSKDLVDALGTDVLIRPGRKALANAWLSRGLCGEKVVRGLAGNLLDLWEEVEGPTRHDTLDYLTLASPAMGESLFEEISCFYSRMNDDQKGAFGANPLYADLGSKKKPIRKGTGFLVGAATFGNLDDLELSAALLKLIPAPDKTGIVKTRYIGNILARERLPAHFLEALYRLPLGASAYSNLCKRPDYRELAKAGKVEDWQQFNGVSSSWRRS